MYVKLLIRSYHCEKDVKIPLIRIPLIRIEHCEKEWEGSKGNWLRLDLVSNLRETRARLQSFDFIRFHFIAVFGINRTVEYLVRCLFLKGHDIM